MNETILSVYLDIDGTLNDGTTPAWGGPGGFTFESYLEELVGRDPEEAGIEYQAVHSPMQFIFGICKHRVRSLVRLLGSLCPEDSVAYVDIVVSSSWSKDRIVSTRFTEPLVGELMLSLIIEELNAGSGSVRGLPYVPGPFSDSDDVNVQANARWRAIREDLLSSQCKRRVAVVDDLLWHAGAPGRNLMETAILGGQSWPNVVDTVFVWPAQDGRFRWS